MAIYFSRVREILDGAVAQWEARTGRPAQLFLHAPSFGWRTRTELLQATARGLRLISPEDISKKSGATSNLVVALTSGVAGFPRMPRGGPFLDQSKIQEIIDWINEGALDDPPSPEDVAATSN